MATECASCLKKITNMEYVTCSQYTKTCANVSLERFCNTLDKKRRKTRVCQYSNCNKPKTGNNNISKYVCAFTTNGVTERIFYEKIQFKQHNHKKKTRTPANNNSFIISDNDSILGDNIEAKMGENQQASREPQIHVYFV